VSYVARVPLVRQILVDQQRRLGHAGPVVMEGRDIGSVVFPDTRFKFYIDASEEVRAERRRAQGIEDTVTLRDRMDASRKNAPLMIAEGACVIDSSDLDLDAVVARVLDQLTDWNYPHDLTAKTGPAS
jgi:cytidylate kinase